MKSFIFLLYVVIFSQLQADVGHSNYVYEGKAFSKPIRVIINTPGVVPGLADIIVKTFDSEINQISVTPVVWKDNNMWTSISSGPQGAPPPDLMTHVKGEKNTYQAELWLMDFGAYNIQMELFRNDKSEIINIPINSIANQIIPMTTTVSIILFLLMLLLVAGLTNIITIGYRESALQDPSNIDSERIKKSYIVQIVSVLIICIILYLSNNWWIHIEQAFMKNLFKPLENEISLVKNDKQHILQILITDEAWVEGRIADFIPDHGKIMHLYLINKNHKQLCHLHPQRNDSNRNLFEVVIPSIEYGKYYIFIDVTLESGGTQTLINKIDYNLNNITNQQKIKYLFKDKDDSYIQNNPSYHFQWLNKKNTYLSDKEINLDFQILDQLNNPVKLEPYIQMGGHGAILDSLGNVFIHIHPIGTISMASQELYNQEYNIQKSGICYFGIPSDSITNYAENFNQSSFLSFPPLILEKEGKYFMWIQGKSNNEIITEKFEFVVKDE